MWLISTKIRLPFIISIIRAEEAPTLIARLRCGNKINAIGKESRPWSMRNLVKRSGGSGGAKGRIEVHLLDHFMGLK